MRLLLISSSVVHGHGYLDHAEAELRDFLGATRRLLFVPFAQADHEAYTTRVREPAMLRREGDALDLRGVGGARLFRRGEAPAEIAPGAALAALLRP